MYFKNANNPIGSDMLFLTINKQLTKCIVKNHKETLKNISWENILLSDKNIIHSIENNCCETHIRNRCKLKWLELYSWLLMCLQTFWNKMNLSKLLKHCTLYQCALCHAETSCIVWYGFVLIMRIHKVIKLAILFCT